MEINITGVLGLLWTFISVLKGIYGKLKDFIFITYLF